MQVWICGRQRLQCLFLNGLALVWVSVVSFAFDRATCSLFTASIRVGSVAEVIFPVPRELIDDLWRETADGRGRNFW